MCFCFYFVHHQNKLGWTGRHWQAPDGVCVVALVEALVALCSLHQVWGKPANGRLLFLQVSFVFLLMRSLGLEAAAAEEVFF